jgi:N-acetylglucosamine kinase-like BadF-type ATPase
MTSERLVIGMDGGGTKTAAELCDASGKVMAASTGGPSNFQVIGVDSAARTIMDLVETCCHSVGCAPERLDSVVAGLTGAGRPGDRERMRQALMAEASRRGRPLRNVRIDSDARIALEGAMSGEPGVIVIAGTGSIVYGKDGAGCVHRSGGWGRVVGDEGSGYAIGRELFRAVAASIDDRSPRTILPRLLKESFGLGTQEAIITAIYRENFDVASVAPVVMEAARKRDAVARRILSAAARELVAVIAPVVAKIRGRSRKAVPVAFIGSLLTSKNLYSTQVRTLLQRTIPGARVRAALAPPVRGAVLLALNEISHTP